MSHPKSMRVWVHPLASAGQVHVYSDDSRIILQLRRAVATEDDVLAPSFKVAVTLAATDALALAAELLSASSKVLAAREAAPTEHTPACES